MDVDLAALAFPVEGWYEPLAYSPLASGRPLGVLGLYGHVEDRSQTIEGQGVEVVGTPFQGACYLWDPDKRQATAVLTRTWRNGSSPRTAGRRAVPWR